MKILDAAMFRVLRPLMTRALRRALRERFPPERSERVIRDVWRTYEELTRERSSDPSSTVAPQTRMEPTVGARLMVRLAVATVAVYQSLRSAGLSAQEAEERTAKVGWATYEKLLALPWAFTSLLARSRIRRVRRAMDLFMRFPYAPPGYQMQYVESDKDVVAFDVHRCPAADYFHLQGLSSLCTAAFCNLDYPLADKWGVKLERSQTLATGATYCDFRFRAHDESKE